MKLLIILMLVAILFISACGISDSCTADAKMCPDGSGVGRDQMNNCEFEDCPEAITCDYQNNCPEGYNCYYFLDEEAPICYMGDPCQKCDSKVCDFTESFPMQVICQ